MKICEEEENKPIDGMCFGCELKREREEFPKFRKSQNNTSRFTLDRSVSHRFGLQCKWNAKFKFQCVTCKQRGSESNIFM